MQLARSLRDNYQRIEVSPGIIGQLNLTPLQLARDKNHPDIVQYLQKHSVIPYIYTAIAIMKHVRLLK